MYLITDIDIRLDPSTFEAAWPWFRDPALGGLCLTPCLSSPNPDAIAWYVSHYERFNRWLKMRQSRLDSVPILHGQAMFICAAAAVAPAPHLPGDDVDFAIQIRRARFRVRYAADVLFFEEIAADRRQLDRQKVRRAKAVMRSLWHHRAVLFNPRYGWFGMMCLPMDVFLYFVLTPLMVGACLAAGAWLVSGFGAAGVGILAATLALALVPPFRSITVYLALLLVASWGLLVERTPRIRWKPYRFDA